MYNSERRSPDQLDQITQRVLGLDIGGANLKGATNDGYAAAVAFPLWLQPQKLAEQLQSLAAGLPACRAWAVTMTGELADVFADRAVGVRTLVEQTMQAATAAAIGDVVFYTVDGCFVSRRKALDAPDAVASANWHALASWVAQAADRPGLLIDVGSTTTDIIAIQPNIVVTESRTDFDRLVSGELLYLGGGRTPVCSLVQQLPFAGRQVPVMRELFATTDDCALVLGLAEEEPTSSATSDGGPRTVAAAVNRLARMIGLDHRYVDHGAACSMARAVIEAAADAIAGTIFRHRDLHRQHWVVAGHTADYFLPQLLARTDRPVITRLADGLGAELSRVAPAYACAKLRYSARSTAAGCRS
jgi:(4-(4-[2-(gamma-L-glutamylamino)ethyl]phenoxymethyl)furan-2-yl)methanamine synthase